MQAFADALVTTQPLLLVHMVFEAFGAMPGGAIQHTPRPPALGDLSPAAIDFWRQHPWFDSHLEQLAHRLRQPKATKYVRNWCGMFDRVMHVDGMHVTTHRHDALAFKNALLTRRKQGRVKMERSLQQGLTSLVKALEDGNHGMAGLRTEQVRVQHQQHSVTA